MGKIWTSRFSNKQLETGNYTAVGIVRSMPKFHVRYRIAGNIIDIAPTWALFREDDRERFTTPYKKHLDSVGLSRIAGQIQKYVDIFPDHDVVLCCYEDVRIPNEWCHRLVFSEWWMEKTGQVIEELPDPSDPKIPGKTSVKPVEEVKQPERPKEKYEQLSFMDDLYRQMYPYYRT